MARALVRALPHVAAALLSAPALAMSPASSLDEAVHGRIREAFCPKPAGAAAAAASATTPLEPARVFDNLYFVGDHGTSAWALTTRGGIVLLDAGFQNNVEGTIVGGMKKLGLNP